MNKLFILLLCIFAIVAKADIVDVTGIRWPIPDWNIAGQTEERMANKQCQDFINFSRYSKKFLTEGLVIIKDGVLQYEGYEKHYNETTPHILWSVSKTITGALLGIAVRDGKISLEQNLNEYVPRPDASENYQQIKIKNLFYLDTGFIWDEYYSGDVVKSPVLSMLYGPGHTDIIDYATSKKIISQGPGYQWNYSTGTPAITMGILKQVYGDTYDDMPWKSFFNPLAMTNVRFERDHKGIFNGGSSAFATPRDMAKIGYLYLNRGVWNGNEILPEDWINKTLEVSPGYLSKGTVIHNITDDGVYGGSIWLNRALNKGFGKPYPYSPEDMFMALGHYGQMIIVLPTQKMVIARTGYDQEYNSNIDEFVSRAISCFDDPNYPIGKNIPPPKSTNPTLGKIFETIKTGLRTNIMQAAVAKTICSCHFISGLDVKTCMARSHLPLAKQLTRVKIVNNTVYAKLSKFAKLFVHIFGFQADPIAKASYDINHPEFGCTLK
jgi:CubicO group peptidase (beta-lactamase class C family)